MTLRVAVVFGTRPEAIKLAPVIAALSGRPRDVACTVVATAQHRGMLDQVLETFGIEPDYDLDIMTSGQSPTRVASLVLDGLDPVLERVQPDWMLVQGDTTTVMAASLAAFHRRVKVGHVEAGLRSGDRDNPFPEEINRRVAGAVADLHFAPTEGAREALLRESVEPWRIAVTGNTVIDALLSVVRKPRPPIGGALREVWDGDRRIVLMTAHRRESFGPPLREVFHAVRELARRFSDDTTVVYPVHPNPNVTAAAYEMLGGIDNVLLTEPLDYLVFAHLMGRAHLILTDSGGIQEEAPSLAKPVLVLRSVTERPEGVAAGTARLVGTDREMIVAAATELLTDAEAYGRMARASNPYGDGHASGRIAEAILSHGSAP
jgi:UDP-N-acetylglucosamine 2-epimerase (non-hydrolysing)